MNQPDDHSLLNPGFHYIRSGETNVAKTWAKFGWIPPDRAKQRETMLRLNPQPEPEAACSTN